MDSLQVPTFDVTPPVQVASDGGAKSKHPKRPHLIIPPPQTPSSPYAVNITIPPQTAHTIAGTPNPYLYHRKASQFMFSQFNGIRDFTMSTAKSGMGIGEKCSFWLYNKVSSWSRKWFTHMFLSIVLVIYTVGGAVLFIYIEGELFWVFPYMDIKIYGFLLCNIIESAFIMSHTSNRLSTSSDNHTS